MASLPDDAKAYERLYNKELRALAKECAKEAWDHFPEPLEDPLRPPEWMEAQAMLASVGRPRFLRSDCFYAERWQNMHRAVCDGAADAEGISNWFAFNGLTVWSDTADLWGFIERNYQPNAGSAWELDLLARRRASRKLMRMAAAELANGEDDKAAQLMLKAARCLDVLRVDW